MQPLHLPLPLLACLALAAPAGLAQQTRLASVQDDGSLFPSHTIQLDLSSDGRYLVFGQFDGTPVTPFIVCRRDLDANRTDVLASLPGSVGDPASDGDGSVVGFRSSGQVWVVDNGTLELVSEAENGGPGNVHSGAPRLSDDGRWVVFMSSSTNLVTGAAFNSTTQIYLRDRTTGTTFHLSASTGGGGSNSSSFHPDISGDGNHVVFASQATDLLANDTNGPGQDVLVYDRRVGALVVVSVNTAGEQANGDSQFPSISQDGRFVAFYSLGTNLGGLTSPSCYLHDRDLDQDGVYDESGPGETETRLVAIEQLGNPSLGIGSSPKVSGDGRWLSFVGSPGQFKPNAGTLDVHLLDLTLGQQTNVHIDSNGNPADLGVAGTPDYGFAISRDGSRVAYATQATSFDPADTNGRIDAYVHDVCPNPAENLGEWLAGTGALKPEFTVCGALGRLDVAEFRLRRARPNSNATLLLTTGRQNIPYFGGTLVPAFRSNLRSSLLGDPARSWPPLGRRVTTDANGNATVSYPGGGGWTMYGQWIISDPGAVLGRSLSNALQIDWGP